MEKESNFMTMEKHTIGEAVGNDNRQQSSTKVVRSTRSARIISEGARYSRSPGIKILKMAGQTTSYHCKFSVNDFRVRNQDVFDEGSDEYDTDLESEEVRLKFCKLISPFPLS